MIDLLKVWMSSKPWFWKCRTWLGKFAFDFERRAYKKSASATKSKANIGILGSFAWKGVKSLLWVFLCLTALNSVENLVRSNLSWPAVLSADDKEFNINQLRLYAQLLTSIFSIYFATIGIILSAGYTRLRRDIIHMLTNEQVGSVYSRVLVLSTIFCLAATALPVFGYESGLFVYVSGTVLALLSALALFPLGRRLFSFFDLNQLVHSEILPRIAHHIECAANPNNSISLANHHSKVARQALEQLSYIDDRIKDDKKGLKDNLPALTNDYSTLLLHYLQRKHTIDHDSYWFPRQNSHKQWFFAGDSATSMALHTSNQLQAEEKTDRQWLENEIVDRLAGHVELAFQVSNYDLGLNLIGRFSTRISGYAEQFQFEVGMEEIKRFKEIIERTLSSSDTTLDHTTEKIKIGIADAWAALGSTLCFETMRRMITFEKELKYFFEKDEWSEQSLHHLPAFLQTDLAFIVDRIAFEWEIEGKRLSKPKYVQQLAIQKLLQHYSKVLPAICDFYQNLIPEFVESLTKRKMSAAATQVVLASLHCYWKLQNWFDQLTQLVNRYHVYGHYTAEQYKLPEINTVEMGQRFVSARDNAISWLGKGTMIKHIFEPKHNDELPDHFGQIYFELAEACICALEKNDESKLSKVLPMFMILAFLAADSKFADPSLDVNEEFRLHLISTVINDLASVLGFAILYGEYFNNEKLSENALAEFDTWIERVPDKQQYFKRMILLSSTRNFSMSISPRDQIRFKWQSSFEHRARHDGYKVQTGRARGEAHPNKIVREFLSSFSNASHLFFAKQVMPQLDSIDFQMDHHITSIARHLRKNKEGQHENF